MCSFAEWPFPLGLKATKKKTTQLLGRSGIHQLAQQELCSRTGPSLHRLEQSISTLKPPRLILGCSDWACFAKATCLRSQHKDIMGLSDKMRAPALFLRPLKNDRQPQF